MPDSDVTALRRWVDYARPQEAVIVYDAAYEAYIRDAEIPRSIYEVEGAREVAIESRSFSKSAGFTGLRMAYTVVPREAQSRSRAGDVVSLNQLWYTTSRVRYEAQRVTDKTDRTLVGRFTTRRDLRGSRNLPGNAARLAGGLPRPESGVPRPPRNLHGAPKRRVLPVEAVDHG